MPTKKSQLITDLAFDVRQTLIMTHFMDVIHATYCRSKSVRVFISYISYHNNPKQRNHSSFNFQVQPSVGKAYSHEARNASSYFATAAINSLQICPSLLSAMQWEAQAPGSCVMNANRCLVLSARAVLHTFHCGLSTS